ncbi:hypothetical protein VTK26DRAFT_1213 [Humicola hyalothermophila]
MPGWQWAPAMDESIQQESKAKRMILDGLFSLSSPQRHDCRSSNSMYTGVCNERACRSLSPSGKRCSVMQSQPLSPVKVHGVWASNAAPLSPSMNDILVAHQPTIASPCLGGCEAGPSFFLSCSMAHNCLIAPTGHCMRPSLSIDNLSDIVSSLSGLVATKQSGCLEHLLASIKHGQASPGG